MEKKIEIHKARDFSGVFTDSVDFIKDNFKGMGKSLVVIVAPLYTMATILVSLFSVKIINAINHGQNSPSYRYSNQYGRAMLDIILDPVFWLAFLSYLAAYIFAIGVVLSYIKLKGAKNDDSDVLPNDVWKYVWPKSIKFFFYSLGYFFVLGAGGFVTFGLYFVVSAILVFIPVIGPILAVLLFFAGFMAIYTVVTVLISVVFYENEGFFNSIGRTINLLKGSFWQSIFINSIAYILVQLVGYIFYVAFMLFFQATDFGFTSFDVDTLKIVLVVFVVLVPIIMFFAYLFQYSVIGFNYFSLLEKKDHVGLKIKIQAISDGIQHKTEEEF